MSALHRRPRLLLLALLLLPGLCGCTRPALPRQVAKQGLTVHDLGPLPKLPHLAWNADGSELLLSGTGTLAVVAVADSHWRRLPLQPAPDLAAWGWGPHTLLLGWRGAQTSRLALARENGRQLATTEVPGRIEFLAATGGGMLAVTSSREDYSFGSRLLLQRVRWLPPAPPSATPLWDVTLKPATARALAKGRLELPPPALSPAGDELALTVLHDPPARAPYLALLLFRTDGAAPPRPLVARDALPRPAFWLGDAETLLVPSAAGRIIAIAPRLAPEDRGIANGHLLQGASPGGRTLLIDDWLLLPGQPPVPLPAVQAAAFSADGSRLALAAAGRLWLLKGLPTDPAMPLPRLRGRWLSLRRWWTQGLLDNDDYAASLESLQR